MNILTEGIVLGCGHYGHIVKIQVLFFKIIFAICRIGGVVGSSNYLTCEKSGFRNLIATKLSR